MRISRAIAIAGAAAAILSAALTGPCLANGVGDLYVATPQGVLEVHVKTSTVVSTIDLTPAPQSLAFTPDGSTLYAGSGGAHVTPIDIATLAVGEDIPTPGPVTALAFPSGQILVGTMPSRQSLAFITVHANTVAESPQLPGSPNLIAADRRDPRVAVAQAGKSWLDVVDPSTSSIKKAELAGEIRALAIDRGTGAVLAATAQPDALVRIDLATLSTISSVPLPVAPAAVVATSGAALVAGGNQLFSVTQGKAAPLVKARGAVVAMAASDEGSFVHVAEATEIEVFDLRGQLQRTIALGADAAPVALAAVPRGSSLYLGSGENGKATPAPAVGTPGALATQKAPSTGTFVDGAAQVMSQPPVQGALLVALVILACCWMFVRWYDRRASDPR